MKCTLLIFDMEQLITQAPHATFCLQEESGWSASQLVTCVPLYVPPVRPSSPVEVLLWRHVTLLIHLQLNRSVIRFLPHFPRQMVMHLCSLSARTSQECSHLYHMHFCFSEYVFFGGFFRFSVDFFLLYFIVSLCF